MIFDINKVVYLKAEKELSCVVKIGTKGYIADNIADLRYLIENEWKYYYDELRSIDEDSDFPFNFVNTAIGYKLFYPVEEPKEKKYRPYTWEEREHLRGKWVKWTNSNNEKKEFQITNMELLTNDKFIINNGITPEILLDMAKFLDGSPCGVFVGDEEIVLRRQACIDKFA